MEDFCECIEVKMIDVYYLNIDHLKKGKLSKQLCIVKY